MSETARLVRKACGAALLLLLPATAYAYLDPGTGSMLLQGLIAAIGASVATIAVYWRAFRMFIARILRLKRTRRDDPREP